MTKPKTVSALLAEANKLARERGGVLFKSDAYFSLCDPTTGIYWLRVYFGELGEGFSVPKDQALRCLIAALREVPVVKRGKM